MPEDTKTEAARSVEPVAAPAADLSPAHESTDQAHKNSPGALVLQWLTYAFWGWFTVVLTWLTALSVAFYISGSTSEYSDSNIVAYSLAAVIVLYLIALVCDVLYSRVEPVRKHGAAMVIMIIHAVIFALAGIAALIAAVFAVVNMLVNQGDSIGAKTTLITGVVIAIVLGATLMRTLRPLKLKKVSLVYGAFMALVATTITVLAIAGPTLSAARTQDDRLIEQYLPNLSSEIREYARDNEKLPANLSDIRDGVRSDTRELIDRNLVEYKPGKEIVRTPRTPQDLSNLSLQQDKQKSYAYQLCVTYKAEKNNDYRYDYEPNGTDTTPNTYSHDEGRVCYELATRAVYDAY